MYIVIRLAEIKKGHLYFRAWSPGQPDNAGTREHCLEIRYTLAVHWNDFVCETSQNFICKTS